MTASRVIELLRKRVHPGCLHLLSEDATFEELGIALVDAWGFAFDWEEETGKPIDWKAIEAAQSVQDIIDIVGLRARIEEGSPA